MTNDDRARRLAELAADLQRATGPGLTAQAALASVLDMVSGATGASITVAERQGRFATLASTSAPASEADRLQYELREGPCLDTTRVEDWSRSSDLSSDDRWPRWGPLVVQSVGLRSVLSVRLIGTSGRFGAVNIYGTDAALFASPVDVDLALLAGIHAGVALSAAREIDGLETALASRHEIGMAQGMLMQRYGLDQTQSFALLRRYSNELNAKLHDVATDLLETRELPVLPDQPPS